MSADFYKNPGEVAKQLGQAAQNKRDTEETPASKDSLFRHGFHPVHVSGFPESYPFFARFGLQLLPCFLQMKVFAVEMMEEYAKSTDNDVDDQLVARIKKAMKLGAV